MSLSKKKGVEGYLCYPCGKKKYPNAKDARLSGITGKFGICKGCGKDKPIIPLRDFEYASQTNPYSVEWD